MFKTPKKFAGKMFRAGDAEYMEYRKQQLETLPEHKDTLSKRKAKLLERLKRK